MPGAASTKPNVPMSASTRSPSSTPTGTQLATAFDGPLPRAKTSPLYLLATLLVFGPMILLPLVYLGIIAAAGAGVVWYAVHATVMFEHVIPGRGILLVVVAYVGPIIAGALLALFMVVPLFWRSKKAPRPMWVDRSEQPLLFAYVDKLCDTMRAPRPVRIHLLASANASAHIDNGMLGLVRRRLVLSIGLPIAQSMDLRQFTGVLAHELGHFTQGASMRFSYAVHRINTWFIRLAYGRSGIDDVIDSMLMNEPHWTVALVGLLTKTVLGIARLILKLLALISHALSMHLSRQAEFDADRQAARIVGSEAMGHALEVIPFLDAASRLAVTRAQSGWVKRKLPDDLVTLTQAFSQQMPAATKDKLTAQILARDARWFDTHPPLFRRIAALKKANLPGVLKLDAPSTCLFRDFDELSKLTTIRMYQTILGQSLQPEHLVPTTVTATEPKRKAITPAGR
jgi:Zn-dependent protease with chaperone function